MNTEHLSKITESLVSDKDDSCPFTPDDESPFPLDALPPILREVAEAVSEGYQAPVDLVAPQTISVVSSCLSKSIRLETHHQDHTFGLLYMFLGTRAGVCKSTVLKHLSAPLKEYQKKVRLDYRNEVREQLIHDFEERSKKPLPKDWQPSKKDINEAVGKAQPTLIAEHYSQEGLATTLSYNDEYLALMSTDVSGVIDMLRGSKSSGYNQGEILLKGYAGESYDCNNKVAMDEHLEEIRLCINWLGTLDTLKTFVTDPQIKGRGLLSRFLFAEIDSPIPFAEVKRRKIDFLVTEKWSNLLTGFLSKYWRSESVETVQMSTEAIQLIVDFRNEYVRVQDELKGLSSLPDRWAENALRIGLILHVCKHRLKPTQHELDEHTMSDAIRIMWWFVSRQMACLESVKDYDPSVNNKKKKVLDALIKNGPCSMRDFYKKAGLTKKDTEMVMQWARDGELVMWNGSQGNKPSPTFALVGDDRIPEGVKLIIK
jgi:hypothetical protein